jgi:membrane protease subunit HflK
MEGIHEKLNRATVIMGQVLQRIRGRMPAPGVILLLAFLAWILSGFFVVGPDEIGVIKTFGRKARTEESGLHYHLPYPISTVLRPKIKAIKRLEFGFRVGDPQSGPAYVEMPSESMMLTGDENIVDLRFLLHFRIKNYDDYLFGLSKPENTVRSAAQAVMRSSVAQLNLDQILTTSKQELADKAALDLQTLLDKYKAGLEVVTVQFESVQPPKQVSSAFKAVVSAREKKNQIINSARSRANEIVPLAQGQAQAMLLQAESYLAETNERAKGETTRFLSLLAETEQSRAVTKQRLYLEAMEAVLSKAGRIILDPQEMAILPFVWNYTGAEGKRIPIEEK